MVVYWGKPTDDYISNPSIVQVLTQSYQVVYCRRPREVLAIILYIHSFASSKVLNLYTPRGQIPLLPRNCLIVFNHTADASEDVPISPDRLPTILIFAISLFSLRFWKFSTTHYLRDYL